MTIFMRPEIHCKDCGATTFTPDFHGSTLCEDCMTDRHGITTFYPPVHCCRCHTELGLLDDWQAVFSGATAEPICTDCEVKP